VTPKAWLSSALLGMHDSSGGAGIEMLDVVLVDTVDRAVVGLDILPSEGIIGPMLSVAIGA
jgi:hypothetical protein